MGFTGVSGMAFVFHTYLFETDPGTHATQKAVALTHIVHDIEGFAINQAKISGVEGNFHISDLKNQLVKERGSGQLKPAFAFPFGAYASTLEFDGKLLPSVPFVLVPSEISPNLHLQVHW